MMYLVRACDLGEALAMRKEYSRLFNAHAAAAAKAEAAVADGSGGRPTATPAAVTLIAPAAHQESVLGAVVGSSAPALAISPVMAKPVETAAAGTSQGHECGHGHRRPRLIFKISWQEAHNISAQTSK